MKKNVQRETWVAGLLAVLLLVVMPALNASFFIHLANRAIDQREAYRKNDVCLPRY
jgi:hypothetical protein